MAEQKVLHCHPTVFEEYFANIANSGILDFSKTAGQAVLWSRLGLVTLKQQGRQCMQSILGSLAVTLEEPVLEELLAVTLGLHWFITCTA